MRLVTNDTHSVSNTSGYIPGKIVLSVTRHFSATKFGYKILRADVNDMQFPDTEEGREAADRLCLERGYLRFYGRNSCGFVMSRAARRRGLTTNCFRYRNQQDRHRTPAKGV